MSEIERFDSFFNSSQTLNKGVRLKSIIQIHDLIQLKIV